MGNQPQHVLTRFLKWRYKHISHKTFTYLMSVVIGFLAGLASVTLKNTTYFIESALDRVFSTGVSPEEEARDRVAMAGRAQREVEAALMTMAASNMSVRPVRTRVLYRTEMATVDDPQAFAFITLLPWREKRGAYVGPYHMGWWPGERAVVAANYENPAGFNLERYLAENSPDKYPEDDTDTGQQGQPQPLTRLARLLVAGGLVAFAQEDHR